MNFQELMSKASANSANASRQNNTKSGHKHKGSGPGVSNSAVKAFLERKEKEQKKKQADEEAARRARIQARLQQSLKGKSDSTPKSSFLNPPYAHEEEEKQEQGEKNMQARRKRDAGAGQHPKAAGSAKPSVEMKNRNMDRTATTNNNKNSRRITKEKSGKAHDFTENGKKAETSKAKKKKKAAPPPPNFEELLAIAEQNKSGLKTTKSKPATVTGKGQTEVEEKKVKRQRHGGGEVSVSQIDEKNMQIKKNGKVSEKAVARAKGKQTGTQRKTSAKEPDKSSKEGSKTLKRTRDSDTIRKTIGKPSKQLPQYARPQEPQLRLNYYPRPSRDSYYYDDDGEEDSDLDGFIDDGEDEGCAEQTDVSSYIKDIFGYDRRRYAMEDEDDSAMESNYNQIEREEKRSSKIAKLEDEIEILKEQAELKRMRDKLKKSQKTRK